MDEIMSLKQNYSLNINTQCQNYLTQIEVSITCYFSSNETFNLHLMEKGISYQ